MPSLIKFPQQNRKISSFTLFYIFILCRGRKGERKKAKQYSAEYLQKIYLTSWRKAGQFSSSSPSSKSDSKVQAQYWLLFHDLESCLMTDCPTSNLPLLIITAWLKSPIYHTKRDLRRQHNPTLLKTGLTCSSCNSKDTLKRSLLQHLHFSPIHYVNSSVLILPVSTRTTF